MKISIITVCLNAEQTITDTIESIQSQTYDNIEHIVIDGGSRDSTCDIIKQYRDKIAFFVSEPDHGVYDAMNKGLRHAHGDFVYFLNANDTLYERGTVEGVAEALKTNPKVECLFGNIVTVTPDGAHSCLQTYESVTHKSALFMWTICHQAIFYHRHLFMKYGHYSLKYKIRADVDFMLRCLVANDTDVVYINRTIARFLLGGLSSNHALSPLSRRETISIAKTYFPRSWFLLYGHNYIMFRAPNIYSIMSNNRCCSRLFSALWSMKGNRLNISRIG